MRLLPIAKIVNERESSIVGIRLIDVNSHHIYEISIQKFLELSNIKHYGIEFVNSKTDVHKLPLGGCSITASKELKSKVERSANKIVGYTKVKYVDLSRVGMAGLVKGLDSDTITIREFVSASGACDSKISCGTMKSAIDLYGEQNVEDITCEFEKFAYNVIMLKRYADVKFNLTSNGKLDMIIEGNAPSIDVPEFMGHISLFNVHKVGKITFNGRASSIAHVMRDYNASIKFLDGCTYIDSNITYIAGRIAGMNTVHMSKCDFQNIHEVKYKELVNYSSLDLFGINNTYVDYGDYIRVIDSSNVRMCINLKRLRFGRVPECMDEFDFACVPELEEIILGKRVTDYMYDAINQKVNESNHSIKITRECR